MYRRNPSTSSSAPYYNVQTYTTIRDVWKRTTDAVIGTLEWVSDSAWSWNQGRTTWASTNGPRSTELQVATVDMETSTQVATVDMETSTPVVTVNMETKTDGPSVSPSPVSAFWTTVDKITDIIKTVTPEIIETGKGGSASELTNIPDVVTTAPSGDVAITTTTVTESVVTDTVTETLGNEEASMWTWTNETIIAVGTWSSSAVLILVLALLICIYMRMLVKKSQSVRMKSDEIIGTGIRSDIKLTEIRSGKQTGTKVKEIVATKMA